MALTSGSYSGMMTARVAQAMFRWAVDPKGSKDVKNEMDDVESRLGDLRSAFYSMIEPAQDLGMLASQFEALGFEVQDYGRRLTESMKMFAEDYISSVEGAEQVSRDWIRTQEELEDAHKRFGRVSAQQLLPFMKLQKEVMELATRFMENYPEIAQIAFGIGTAMVLATSLANAVSKGIRLYADVKVIALEAQRVLAAKLIRDSANKQLAAGTMMLAAADKGQVSAGGMGIGGLAKGVFKGAGGVGGILAGLASMLAVGAAVAAMGAAFLQWQKFTKDVKKGTNEITDAWTVYMDKATKSTDGAAGAVEDYRRRQDDIRKTLDETGSLTRWIIDENKVLNREMKGVHRMLKTGANSYEDYADAVEDWNDTLKDGEHAIIAVDEASFNMTRQLEKMRNGLQTGEVSLRAYAEELVRQGNVFGGVQAGVILYAHAITQEHNKLNNELLDGYIAYKQEEQRIHDEMRQARVDAWSTFKEEYESLEEETLEARMKVLDQWELDSTKVEIDAASAREDALQRFRQDITDLEENIAMERQQAMIDFKTDMSDAEKDYYQERSEAAADFGEETRRTEEDHRREMQRMREDSELRQMDAIRSRDALALLEERRSYERDRRRSEEDYSVEAGRRSADFAKQLAQMEQAFQQQQSSREQAYQQQLKDLESRLAEETASRRKALAEEEEEVEASRVNQQRELYDSKEEELGTLEDAHDEQLSEQKDTLNKTLSEAKNAHRDQLNENRRAWNQELKDAGFYNDKEYQQYQEFRRSNLEELERFVRDSNRTLRGLSMPSFNTPTDFNAGGGYAGYGLYRMGETGDEFVLSNSTTRAAEKLMGGKLTQEGMLASMAGSARSATANVTLVFPNANIDEEKVGKIAYEQTYKAINDVFSEVS